MRVGEMALSQPQHAKVTIHGCFGFSGGMAALLVMYYKKSVAPVLILTYEASCIVSGDNVRCLVTMCELVAMNDESLDGGL